MKYLEYFLEKFKWVGDSKLSLFKFLKFKDKSDIIPFFKSILGDLGYDYDETDLLYIGSGFYGLAFKMVSPLYNKPVVLKITKDISEYNNALRLVDKKTKYIAEYYLSRPIYIKHKQTKYYIIILEFLEPLTDNQSLLLEFITRMNSNETITREYIEGFIKTSDDEIQYYLDQIEDIRIEAKKYNLSTQDLHECNMGWKNNHLAWFDIGADTYFDYVYDIEPIKFNF